MPSEAEPTPELRRTALYGEHLALGGRMVAFAGYAMPVQYQSVLLEAQAVRQNVGMFDVSHMARIEVSGTKSLPYLEHVTTNDVGALALGQGQYSLLPNQQGGTVDDIVLYRLDTERYMMVLNASNHEKDLAHLSALLPAEVDIKDVTEQTSMIAVQGPNAREIVASVCSDSEYLEDLDLFSIREASIADVNFWAARSGYTGEDGFELVMPAESSVMIWRTLIEAGVTPCGLASRDTLRVEAGLPLYGHELSDERSPLEAGLGWVISKKKAFLGSDAINKAREEGIREKLVGIRLDSRRLMTPGATVQVEGQSVGTVESGVISPTLGTGIGFAFVHADVPLKTPCVIVTNTGELTGIVTGKRFLKAK